MKWWYQVEIEAKDAEIARLRAELVFYIKKGTTLDDQISQLLTTARHDAETIAALRAELAIATEYGLIQWRKKDLAQLDADRFRAAARRDADTIARLREAMDGLIGPYATLTEEALRDGILMEHGPPKPERGLAILRARAALAHLPGGR